VTDSNGRRFIAAEHFARGALDLAGATATPLRIWVEDWSAAGTATHDALDLTLTAKHENAALDLRLVASKRPVAHGDRGLDAKGPEPGNASYYYSISRLDARGTITVDGRPRDVEGLAWMDREWSTSALANGVVGWDWFALQLSNGRDLMFYRLRHADGSASVFSGGSLIGPDGDRIALGAHDVELEVMREWLSPGSRVLYPIAWRLAIPREEIVLEIVPYLDDQELDLSVRYWEGAVRARGTAATEPLSANGYLELAGY
jgi:predicted secreted hydrolase